MSTLTAGEQIDALVARMDAAYAALRAAGRPSSGPEVDALAAVYSDLRAWTAARRSATNESVVRTSEDPSL